MDKGESPVALGERGPFPKLFVREEALDATDYGALLSYILSNETAFQGSNVRAGYRPAVRNCLSVPLPENHSWGARLRHWVMEQVPSLLEQLAIKPFELRTTELEISAYNDGAFFRRHIDTVTGVGGLDSHRIVSGVLYLHGQPRRFEGGELRIFPYGAFDAAGDEHLDVQPSANSCVFFPSWAPHEVRPVRCPSGQFQDSRFAINIWLKGRP